MEKKIIVITGASGGIGAALVRKLGPQGHSLVLAARREKELKQVAGASGTKALPVVTDVTVRKDVNNLRDAAIKEFGHIDVWINNAGRGLWKKVLDLTDEDVDEMIKVNLKSVVYGMQAVIPHFQQRGKGHLINISSFLGRVPLVPARSVYSAAKAGVNSLTANLRMDLKAKYPAIHVSVVMPSLVATEFAANSLGGSTPPAVTATAPQAQNVDEVAAVIAGLLDNPQAEIYTNKVSADIAQLYYQDIAAFEDKLRQ
jgi:NADP-dependent 3-hydroxy acid dehydrogenase YdfG